MGENADLNMQNTSLGVLLGPLIISVAAAVVEEIHRLVSVSAALRPADEGAKPPVTVNE
jgi:hypothetical protein